MGGSVEITPMQNLANVSVSSKNVIKAESNTKFGMHIKHQPLAINVSQMGQEPL